MNLFKIITLLTITITLLISPLYAESRTAQEWLKEVDHHLTFMTAELTSSMIIHYPNNKERLFRFSSKIMGDKCALMEFIDPPRERGTRYLKNDDKLWIYFPRQDRTMLIQGHMLREGVQGGDISYEDMTESQSLLDMYDPKITEENDTTLTIKLTAKDLTVTYPFREIILDKKSTLPLKITYFGIGEVPIKEMVVIKIQKIGKRHFPVVSQINSLLVENKWTRWEIDEVEFGMDFPQYIFSREYLEKSDSK